MRSILSALVALLIPALTHAASINLYDAPNDTAKVVGTIDLTAGVIPIYTPEKSQWIKVGDPRNGNTGWVKNSEMKDSHGNAITFSQKITDNGSSHVQSMQMNVGNQPLTPDQQAALQHQQKFNAESLQRAQQTMDQALDAAKKTYQQTLELMQNAGFPKIPDTNAPAATQAAPVQPTNPQPK